MNAVTGRAKGHAFDLAVELGRPIALGFMQPYVAEAAIMARAVQTLPADTDLEKLARFTRWTMREATERFAVRREITALRIERRTLALAERLEATATILLEARAINEGGGRPFGEAQIQAIVKAAIRRVLAKEEQEQRRRRRGR